MDKARLWEIEGQLQGLLGEVRAALTKRKRVHVIAVLDESGSMEALRKDTIGSFNKLVEEQRADKSTDTVFTVITFATGHKVLVEAVEAEALKPLTEADYSPSGGTALNDAMMAALRKYDPQAFRSTDDADAYVVLVITDGDENSSRHASKRDVLQLIGRLEATKRFTFTYVGSQADAWGEASTYGVHLNNFLSYTPTSGGVSQAYRSVSSSLSNLKSNVAVGGVLSTEDFFQPTTPESAPSSAEGEEA